MNRMVEPIDILVIGAFATAMLAWLCFPWIDIPKRFSLRTMLIVTTLVAVVLGLVCYSVR